MRGIVFGLLMGISVMVFAAKAEPTGARLVTPDLSKLKVEVEVDSERAKPIYAHDAETARFAEMGLLTKDNVSAVNNMARIMRDKPDVFIQQVFNVTPDDKDIVWPNEATNRLGSTKEAKSAEVAIESDDPLEMMKDIRFPELTGSYDDLEVSRIVMKSEYDKAMKQVGEIGRKQLGRKTVSTFVK